METLNLNSLFSQPIHENLCINGTNDCNSTSAYNSMNFTTVGCNQKDLIISNRTMCSFISEALNAKDSSDPFLVIKTFTDTTDGETDNVNILTFKTEDEQYVGRGEFWNNLFRHRLRNYYYMTANDDTILEETPTAMEHADIIDADKKKGNNTIVKIVTNNPELEQYISNIQFVYFKNNHLKTYKNLSIGDNAMKPYKANLLALKFDYNNVVVKVKLNGETVGNTISTGTLFRSDYIFNIGKEDMVFELELEEPSTINVLYQVILNGEVMDTPPTAYLYYNPGYTYKNLPNEFSTLQTINGVYLGMNDISSLYNVNSVTVDMNNTGTYECSPSVVMVIYNTYGCSFNPDLQFEESEDPYIVTFNITATPFSI